MIFGRICFFCALHKAARNYSANKWGWAVQDSVVYENGCLSDVTGKDILEKPENKNEVASACKQTRKSILGK